MALNLQVEIGPELASLQARLEAWLDRLEAYRGATLADLSPVQGSGSANATLTGRIVRKGGPAAGERIVVRLPVAEHTPFLDKRLVRQAKIIGWVRSNSSVPVPELIGAEDDSSVIGRPFMVMHHIGGDAAKDFPGYNIAGFLTIMTPAQRRELWQDAVATLAALHRLDTSAIDFLDFPGSATSRLPELLRHWQASLDWARDDLDHRWFRRIFDWLDERRPLAAPQGLSWGDARIGNMLFAGGKCTAVLDWEMASLGGPLVDLAWWLLFDRIQDEDSGVARLDGLGSRTETIDLWGRLTGHDSRSLPWFEVLAAFQLAITRAKAFALRKARGLPVPDDGDPRSVVRLQRRIEILVDEYGGRNG